MIKFVKQAICIIGNQEWHFRLILFKRKKKNSLNNSVSINIDIIQYTNITTYLCSLESYGVNTGILQQSVLVEVYLRKEKKCLVNNFVRKHCKCSTRKNEFINLSTNASFFQNNLCVNSSRTLTLKEVYISLMMRVQSPKQLWCFFFLGYSAM